MQCQRAESNNSTGSFCGRWLSKSLTPGSDEQLVFRDHALREDGQACHVWGAAVCSSYHTNLCDNGEICQTHTRCERTQSNSLLACGGSLYRLCDIHDPAGVGSSEISDSEEAKDLQRDHTVVSTAVVLCCGVSTYTGKKKTSFYLQLVWESRKVKINVLHSEIVSEIYS